MYERRRILLFVGRFRSKSATFAHLLLACVERLAVANVKLSNSGPAA